MANMIEEAKSGRATCRSCRQKIDKGALRFGEETVNQFDADGGTSYFWHHILCAAQKKGALLKPVLEAYTGNVPNRAELDAAIANPSKGGGGGGGRPKANYPYAERASTGRSKCIQCDEAIGKGDWRVAVEREVDTGTFTRTGPGYLHPGCAVEQTGDEELMEKIKVNTAGLSEADANELAGLMAPA
jgi:hypothetical protein